MALTRVSLQALARNLFFSSGEMVTLSIKDVNKVLVLRLIGENRKINIYVPKLSDFLI